LEAEKRKKRSCLDLDNGSVYTGGKHKWRQCPMLHIANRWFSTASYPFKYIYEGRLHDCISRLHAMGHDYTNLTDFEFENCGRIPGVRLAVFNDVCRIIRVAL
jgi:hypothetical protein